VGRTRNLGKLCQRGLGHNPGAQKHLGEFFFAKTLLIVAVFTTLV